MSDVVAAVNLLICVGVVWACLCRLRTELCRQNLLPRFKYSVLLTGGLVAGLPNLFFGEEASKSTLVLSASILVYLASNVLSWKGKNDSACRKY